MRPALRSLTLLLLALATLGVLSLRFTLLPAGRVGREVPAVSGRLEVLLGARRIGWAREDGQGVLWLPAEVVREHFDPALRLTGRDKAQTSSAPWRLTAASPGTEAFLAAGEVLVEFHAPGGWVPIEVLAEMYGIVLRRGGSRLLIDWAGREIPVVSARRPVRLRGRPWPLWPGKVVPAGTPLLVYDRVGGWLLVRSEGGVAGYVPVGQVQEAGTRLIELPPRPDPVRVRGPVCLTWEHVIRPGGPDLTAIGPLPGVNVVSPTWLHLAGEDGSLSSACHASYVRWAHARGYAVWVLVGNNFDPDLTRRVLQDGKAREHLIRQLLVYCRLFGLDGVNVDFENVYPTEKGAFVRFVEELSRLAHPEGLVVSVDVTVKSPSPTWSGFLDRRALARAADYLAVMTYDEHYAGSPRAGSVASLPWVEQGIRGLLEEVPPGKLLLGIPFYTRLWKLERPPGGAPKLTSRALGMEEVEALLAERGIEPTFDPASGQDYARWEEGGATFQVWLENERSILARLKLAAKYGLAGVASWRRGFEKPAVWDVIAAELNSLR
ncbi:MAG: glycosyl hydrolase family 18 protein [Bacillota bacterium]